MDFELELIKYGAYVIAGILGWFVRVLWTAQDQMRKDFSELEKQLPEKYITKDDFREVIRDVKEGFKEAINPVLRKLDRMEERMDEQRADVERNYQRKAGQ